MRMWFAWCTSKAGSVECSVTSRRQVVRTAPGDTSDAAAALVDAIAQEFVDLPERQAAVAEMTIASS